MLDLHRYLLGVAEIGLLAGSAWLGATQVRRRLLPGFDGASAHLATAVLAFALLVWVAELLGTVALFEPLPYVVVVTVAGLGTWGYGRGSCRRRGVASAALRAASGRDQDSVQGTGSRPQQPPGSASPPHPDATRGRNVSPAALIAIAIAAVAVVRFAADVKVKLGTGMTGFDSTWYHGPFAAGFFQSGSTWDLHFIAPQFLAWFYPANSEVFHAIGMLAFDRDVLSPLLNLGWFVGCLVACWCIGRPFNVAPWSLALGAIALSVPALADQAGEARNDIVGIFFLLAAVAIALNAVASRDGRQNRSSGRADSPSSGRAARSDGLGLGVVGVAGLAAGLAAGTKLNFLLPAAVLVIGLVLTSPAAARWRSFAAAGLAALAGGGYWYLRNLVHTGNPLPWVDSVGPISLPAPDQALGGREGHSVLGYLTDGSVWSDWFFPALHDGLWFLWPLLLTAAFAGLLLCLVPAKLRPEPRKSDSANPPRNGAPGVLFVAALTGLAAALAWLIAPTSASGPEGMPRGFESGLRYLAPALVLGLALLPVVLPLRLRQAGVGSSSNGRILKASSQLARRLSGRGAAYTCLGIFVVATIVVGYPVQRYYLERRYADPSFTTPGLNAAFAWSRDIADARIATTSTRQYPLFGTDLSNQVEFVGAEQPHGGFTTPTTCPQWRRLLNEGNYDYVIASRDRIEPEKLPYPLTARWAESPGVTVVLREPPTVVYKLSGPLDPSACP